MLTETWPDAAGAQHNRPKMRLPKTRTETLDTIPPHFCLAEFSQDVFLGSIHPHFLVAPAFFRGVASGVQLRREGTCCAIRCRSRISQPDNLARTWDDGNMQRQLPAVREHDRSYSECMVRRVGASEKREWGVGLRKCIRPLLEPGSGPGWNAPRSFPH